MKPLTAVALLTLCSQVGMPAAQPPAATTAEELQRFQGTWVAEAWEDGGKALAAADLKQRGVFVGANLLVFRRDDKVIQASVIQLDPNKSPSTVNLSVKEGEGKDGVMLGIYSLEGETLKLCYDPQGQTRPTDFKPDAKAGFTLVTLKKPKPAADETVEIAGRYRSEQIESKSGKLIVTDVLVEKRGDAYAVTYRLEDKVLYVGTALRKGSQLSMGWVSSGQAGVSVYKIEAGPKLVGDFTILGGIGMTGKEVLTRWRQVD